MGATKESAKESAQTILERYGPGWISERGRKGGSAKNPNKGFGSSKQRARSAGSLGGRVSRRSKIKKWGDNNEK